MPSEIPINNIFHMLCYAWNVLDQSDPLDVDRLDVDKPIDLFSRVVVSGTNHLIRYGLGQEYRTRVGELNTIRGRVDILSTERRLLSVHGRAICSYEEMDVDFINNQIIKATLVSLKRHADLDKSIKSGLGSLVGKLRLVSNIKLSSSVFRRVVIHANSRVYRLLMSVCELIFDQSLLDQRTGRVLFRDFVRDERKMAKVYEKFLFNFYSKSQSEYKVSSERISWEATSSSDPDLLLLPSMLTDISLKCSERHIVVDAKYYTKTISNFYGSRKIHSNNLYQMNAYLQNLRQKTTSDLEGILLYPVVNEEISEVYEISGNTIRIETVDLARGWQDIEEQLLGFIFK